MEEAMRITTLGAAIAIIGLTGGAFAEGTSSPSSTSPAAGSSQNAAFCLEKSAGAKTCTYATMAACEAVKTGSDKCAPNPAASSTTGAGTSGSSSSMSPPSSPSTSSPSSSK
jgi:hypothetical protein